MNRVQLLARLIILLSVLVMPLGMNAAMAMGRSNSVAQMPMDHCGDEGPRHGMKGDTAECTMACAAALPATDAPKSAPPIVVCEPVLPTVAERLHGLHPETATPPPRRS